MAQEQTSLERIAAELAALGAEASTARNAERIVPWFVSFVLHVGVVALALVITWTVTNLPQKEDAILIVADFNAMNYAPVVGTDSPETVVTGPQVRANAPPGAQTAEQQ